MAEHNRSAPCWAADGMHEVPGPHMVCVFCSHLTALVLGEEEEHVEGENSEGDEHMAALAHAIPQLCALKLLNYGLSATDAGLQRKRGPHEIGRLCSRTLAA